MEIKEFEVPVPWGYVAVKAWGDEANIPVLVIHGLSDNAGSFDRLLPFLPAAFYYICIDLPSHGKSSPYPPHLLISLLDNVLTIKYIVDYLNRQKYIFMGHSWGGQSSLLFAQLYPEHVIKLIAFDTFYMFPMGVTNFKNHLVDKFDVLMRVHQNIVNNKQPTYTYEEAVTKLISNRLWGELYRESAEALIKRSLIPAENGRFRLSVDPRLKAFVNPLCDTEFVVKVIKKYPVMCPILFVYASENEAQHTFFKGFIKELKKRNKICKVKKVTGSHDVHNNSPEVVGPIVSKFLIKGKNKL